MPYLFVLSEKKKRGCNRIWIARAWTIGWVGVFVLLFGENGEDVIGSREGKISQPGLTHSSLSDADHAKPTYLRASLTDLNGVVDSSVSWVL